MSDETIRRDSHGPAQAELDALLLETASVEGYLEDFATRAADQIAPGTHCGITLRHRGHDRRAASSDARVARCDEAELRARAGPCLTAAETGEPVLGIDIAHEVRWPRWQAAALDVGFRSAIAVPSRAGQDAVIALNLYWEEPGAGAPPTLPLAQAFADQVARVVALCLQITAQTVMNADLTAAMASRSAIDQAVGVIMAQNRCGPQEAFELLRAASSHRNQKLRDVAAAVVRNIAGAEPTPSHFHPRGTELRGSQDN